MAGVKRAPRRRELVLKLFWEAWRRNEPEALSALNLELERIYAKDNRDRAYVRARVVRRVASLSYEHARLWCEQNGHNWKVVKGWKEWKELNLEKPRKYPPKQFRSKDVSRLVSAGSQDSPYEEL
jgi:hypothetical protein